MGLPKKDVEGGVVPRGSPAESFGKFLARKGVLSQKELEDATQYLVVVGGRLGTNLVDLGYLGIEDLDRYP